MKKKHSWKFLFSSKCLAAHTDTTNVRLNVYFNFIYLSLVCTPTHSITFAKCCRRFKFFTSTDTFLCHFSKMAHNTNWLIQFSPSFCQKLHNFHNFQFIFPDFYAAISIFEQFLCDIDSLKHSHKIELCGSVRYYIKMYYQLL